MENIHSKKNKIYIGISIMILAALCTAFGQLFWKLSEAAINYELAIGFVLYAFGAVLMIVAFRFGELSILHPFLGIGYVISTLIGYFFLQESISLHSLIGIVLIILGVIVIGGESD